MLHLFHGESISTSRKDLTNLRAKFPVNDVIELDGKKITVTDLLQAVESGSLFGGLRLIIVENLFGKRLAKKSGEAEAFLDYIKTIPKETEIVFWEEKEITKTFLAKLPKHLDVALFRPDKFLFTFMDSIVPKGTLRTLTLYEKIVRSEPVDLIFSLLARQFRYLLLVKQFGKKVTELSPWQITKFAKQADSYSMKELLTLYQMLYDLEIRVKSGNSPFDLSGEIKLFLLKI